MKLIIFLTFAISSFVLSGRNPQDVADRLALGSLESYFDLGFENVSFCYQGQDDDYVESIIFFLEKIEDLKKKVESHFSTNTNDKNHMDLALKEMKSIGNGLKNFIVELKKNIFNGNLKGGHVIRNQKHKTQEHYTEYEKHMEDLEKSSTNFYNLFAKTADGAFQDILQESDLLTQTVIECCELKNITYV